MSKWCYYTFPPTHVADGWYQAGMYTDPVKCVTSAAKPVKPPATAGTVQPAGGTSSGGNGVHFGSGGGLIIAAAVVAALIWRKRKGGRR